MIKYDKNEFIAPDVQVSYRTVNGLNLPIDIFNPKVKNEKNDYAVIAIHGGAWRTGIKPDTEWKGGDMIHQSRIFSLLGYTGVSISYRSIENEGTDIKDLIDDCKEAFSYVKEKLGFDNEHIILIGDSAGAHLATCLGISDDDSTRPSIVISCNPVLDCTKKFSFASNDEGTRVKASPLFADINKCAKFLFMHGLADTTVPPEDTVLMHERLKKLGFDTELITLENVSHAFILYNYKSTDEDLEKYMITIVDYLERKLFKQ